MKQLRFNDSQIGFVLRLQKKMCWVQHEILSHWNKSCLNSHEVWKEDTDNNWSDVL